MTGSLLKKDHQAPKKYMHMSTCIYRYIDAVVTFITVHQLYILIDPKGEYSQMRVISSML